MRYSGPGEAGEGGAPSGQGTDSATSASIGQLLMSLLNDIPGLISDRIHLLALELRRARQSFVRMALLGVLAAILAATAWIALWGFVAVLIAAMGMPWYGVFALIVVLNCIAAWMVVRRALTLVDDLTLPATLRRLTLAPSPHPRPSAVDTEAVQAGRDVLTPARPDSDERSRS